jgi:hypothetical protein
VHVCCRGIAFVRRRRKESALDGGVCRRRVVLLPDRLADRVVGRDRAERQTRRFFIRADEHDRSGRGDGVAVVRGWFADYRKDLGYSGREQWDPMFNVFVGVLLFGALMWAIYRRKPVE